MKSAYRGDQPVTVWRDAWVTNMCERLTRAPAINGEHPEKNLSVITSIVAVILLADPSANLADVKDEAKYACQRRNLAYSSHVIGLALDAASRERRLL